MKKRNQPKPLKKMNTGSQLIRDMIVTVLCSALLILGSLAALKAILTGAGFVAMAGPSASEEAEQSRLSLVALSLLVGAPLVLSIYLRPIKRGLLAGVLALIAGMFGGHISGMLYDSNVFRSVVSGALQRQLSTVVIIASMMITTILVATGRVKSQYEFSGLGLGLLVGLALSIIASIVIQSEVIVFSSGIILIWVSSVFFVEYFKMRRN